jgi:hypothetical protein
VICWVANSGNPTYGIEEALTDIPLILSNCAVFIWALLDSKSKGWLQMRWLVSSFTL